MRTDSDPASRVVPAALLEALRRRIPVAVGNPFHRDDAMSLMGAGDFRDGLQATAIADAEARLRRFAPVIARLFPETESQGGLIESPLRSVLVPDDFIHDGTSAAPVLAKLDGELPVAGSIKARGGIYAVLAWAEELALRVGFLSVGGDYDVLCGERARAFFSDRAISVASTGNLALSIGIMSAKLGFRVIVHMSRDAKEWKKTLLRRAGATVVEHEGDYVEAIAAARAEAEADPSIHFIDDENSPELFYGYAVAGARVARQLEGMSVSISEENPLTVYLPCGVGGAPGGITFGLKTRYGSCVRCIIVEPVSAPSMLYGVFTGRYDGANVNELGLDGRTEADGLAVTSTSRFVTRRVEPLVDGFVTVDDDSVLLALALLDEWNGIRAEPSAASAAAAWLQTSRGTGLHPDGVPGLSTASGPSMLWLTGGGMMPDDQRSRVLSLGRSLLGGDSGLPDGR